MWQGNTAKHLYFKAESHNYLASNWPEHSRHCTIKAHACTFIKTTCTQKPCSGSPGRKENCPNPNTAKIRQSLSKPVQILWLETCNLTQPIFLPLTVQGTELWMQQPRESRQLPAGELACSWDFSGRSFMGQHTLQLQRTAHLMFCTLAMHCRPSGPGVGMLVLLHTKMVATQR